MENIASQDEISLGVLDHDAVHSEKVVPLWTKSATKLENMLQLMDLLPL